MSIWIYSILLVCLVHLALTRDSAIGAVRGQLEDLVPVGPVLGGVLCGSSALRVEGFDGIVLAGGAGGLLRRGLAEGYVQFFAVIAGEADVVVGWH
jgi:hypothetical protein